MLNPTDKLFAKAHFSTLALVVVLFLVAMILGSLLFPDKGTNNYHAERQEA